MAVYTIDGSNITSRSLFWDAYITVVQPEGAELFGRNLDALNDAFWGGPGWPGDDFVLQISKSEEFEEHVGSEFVAKLKDVFEDSQSAKLVLM
jgi:RNAse (barnase) inhibitor barstar